MGTKSFVVSLIKQGTPSSGIGAPFIACCIIWNGAAWSRVSGNVPDANGQRRYYRLTARGRATWRRQRAQWQAFSTFVNALLGL